MWLSFRLLSSMIHLVRGVCWCLPPQLKPLSHCLITAWMPCSLMVAIFTAVWRATWSLGGRSCERMSKSWSLAMTSLRNGRVLCGRCMRSEVLTMWRSQPTGCSGGSNHEAHESRKKHWYHGQLFEHPTGRPFTDHCWQAKSDRGGVTRTCSWGLSSRLIVFTCFYFFDSALIFWHCSWSNRWRHQPPKAVARERRVSRRARIQAGSTQRMRLAYVLQQAFARSFPSLSWNHDLNTCYHLRDSGTIFFFL